MKFFFSPRPSAVTGEPLNPADLQDGFDDESLFFGVSSLDAPQVLPMGGVRVLYEDDKFVHAIDFVSSERSA